ncbi:MAG TPA: putative sugar nucleotidyl transferase [Chitinophagaceae bacterium]|jgi:UDP-N-acetylglucosamine diphosphorylase/glucosamine-1-phosphate N-acetyltransferase|nr:putative sugar nucleotidyl transferase [Chitinophagaceae bacterium]
MPVKIIFTEEFCQPENLYPFTLTRQIQDIRVGILTIREKWEKILAVPSYDRLEDDYKDLDRSIRLENIGEDDTCFMIHGNILPTPKLIKALKKLKDGEFISANGNTGVIFRFSKKEIHEPNKIKVSKAITIRDEIKSIQFPWDIFQINDHAIREDFQLLTEKRKSQKISKTNRVIKAGNIFIEKGAVVEHCILNASEGPIYIGKNSLVMEGAAIRGPFGCGEHTVIKMNTRIYGATSIGPYCTVGGEIKNSVFFAYSNKAHDGYIGDSVIGEWCNLGSGTSNSNIKNNSGIVKVWTAKGEMNAGQKCGVFMGDYSKTSINTSINTGTVIGVCSTVFEAGLTPKYIPSFSWGSDGLKRYELQKALADIDSWKKLKGGSITENEKTILSYIFKNY